jgi:hypothetical protein
LFDSCRTERVLQHVEDSFQAFADFVRVVRPGRRIVVADPDYGTDGGRNG